MAQTRCPMDTRDDDLATQFIVSAGSVEMPIGAFLLVRKGSEVGAIRLTGLEPLSADRFGKSTYESFHADSSGSFRGKHANTGEVNLTAPSKKGPVIVDHTQYRVWIGKWAFAFSSPIVMGMTENGEDQGYEFAPTSACNVAEIDAHDKRLRWFRFDRDTKIVLALADLAK
jgi:hypothetical protein